MKGQREEARRVLRSVMLDGKQIDPRIEACQALWTREQAREIVPVLCGLLRDSPCVASVDALSKLAGAEDDVRAFLKPLLRHELRSVRLHAWQILDHISPEPSPALAQNRPPTK
jgi:hypothetical protein